MLSESRDCRAAFKGRSQVGPPHNLWRTPIGGNVLDSNLAPDDFHAEPTDGLKSQLIETMHRFFRMGFVLIPLGGSDGKKPLISGWNGRRLSLDVCLKRMATVNSMTYGVRLDGLLVIDLDTKNEATRKLFADRFSPSPLVVKTGRGEHHYYRHDGLVPAAIREPDVAIDFKTGGSAFVVGPGSVRPDGKTYDIQSGDVAVELPTFRDRRPPATPEPITTGKVSIGERNGALYRRSIEYAPCADSLDGLVADLAAMRDIEFDDAASVTDTEIIKVAGWAWGLRLEGRLWAGRNSTVRINRLVLDCLLPLPNGAEAYALYSVVMANHSHQPGKTFSIVPDAMISAGLLKIGRRQIYRARDLLLEFGLIVLVRRGRLKEAHQYRLQSPVVALASWGTGEGVSKITFSTLLPHGKETTCPDRANVQPWNVG
jgi:hypothetical protein